MSITIKTILYHYVYDTMYTIVRKALLSHRDTDHRNQARDKPVTIVYRVKPHGEGAMAYMEATRADKSGKHVLNGNSLRKLGVMGHLQILALVNSYEGLDQIKKDFTI